MKRYPKLLNRPALLVCSALFLFAFTTDPGILQSVLERINRYHTENPQEKIYLQFDKPFYVAGDSVWFKAYVVEASLHSVDSQSRVVYAELLNSSNRIIHRKILYASGISFGEFALPDTLREGKYLVRAYTNYMRNASEDFYFKKEISILNPAPAYTSTVQSEMINPDSTHLQFFPEGGELVACGKLSRVAFKVIGQDGKSLSIEGEILDDQQKVITTFKTEHNGMGSIWLSAVAGKSYQARITKPYPVSRMFSLPKVQHTGYSLQVNQVRKNITVVAFSDSQRENTPIGLVVQCRGKAYHAQEGIIKREGFSTTLQSEKLPEGINQVTLFDAAGRPVAERLIYVNHGESLSLHVKLDSTVKSYKKRERVTVYADAAYPNGKPAQGNFSITVYDDKLVRNPEEYPSTINNYLSLTSDLKGNIENAGYYFKDTQPETKRHLDLLMMTQGWRRYTWQDVLNETGNSEQQYKHEKGIPISGRVMKGFGKKPLPGSQVKIMTMQGNVIVLKPDSLGHFYNDDLLFYDSMSLVIQVENEKGKKHPNMFLLDPAYPPSSSYHAMKTFTPFKAPEYAKQQAEKNTLDKRIQATILQEVEVTAKKPDPVLEAKLMGFKGNAIVIDEKVGKSYADAFEILTFRQQPGVHVQRIITRGVTNIYIRGELARTFINGRGASSDEISSISGKDIQLIEIDRLRFTVNFVTRESYRYHEPIGMSRIKIQGLYQAREFYSPRYDVTDLRHFAPDKRTTLYWEPVVQTDSLGRVAVSFYTADSNSRYRIIMEGITPDGCAGSVTHTFEVK